MRPLIAQNAFIDLTNRVALNKTIFYAVTSGHEVGAVKGILVLCFNDAQQRLLRESRYDEILNAQQLLKKNKAIKPGLEKYFNANGHLIRKKLAEAEEFDGYSCLFSTKWLSKEKIIRSYFDKDLVEKNLSYS